MEHELNFFDKFEGVDFKYDNSFLKFKTKNTKNKAVFVPNLRIFFFAPKFAIRPVQGCLFLTSQ